MIQASAARQQVQGDVEDVVCFVVGGVHLQERHGPVDVLAKVDPLDQLHDRGDSSARDRLLLLGELKVGPGRRDHGCLRRPVFVDSTEQSSLAFSQCPPYFGLHSKPFFACGNWFCSYLQLPAKTPRVSGFSQTFSRSGHA